MNEHDQPVRLDDCDRVFNEETCRAIRKIGYETARMFVPAFTIVLFFVVAGLQGVVSVLDPWSESLVGVVLSALFAVTLIAELRWLGVSVNREAIREMWAETKQDFTRLACEYAGDPKTIEAQVLEDTNEPIAYPELAFGFAPIECAVVGAPLGLLVVGIGAVEDTILFIGICLAFAGILFVTIKHSPVKVSTYPPEDPP